MQIVVAAAIAFPVGFFYGMAKGAQATSAGFDAWSDAVLKPLLNVTSTVAGGLFLLFELRRRGWLAEVGWRRCPRRYYGSGACFGVAFGLCWWYAVIVLADHGFEPSGRGPMAQMAEGGGWQTASWVLLVVALAPWIEETLFRGIFFTCLANRWGKVAGGLVSTSLFVVMHYGELVYYPVGAFPITTMALAALSLRVRSGSLGPAVAVHLGYNCAIAGPVALWVLAG